MRTRRAGFTLPVAMMAVAVSVIIVAGGYALTRIQVRETIYQVRQAQAREIAQAGLEDALFYINQSPGWKTGYTCAQRPFGGGCYTVTVSNDMPPIITVKGYSSPILGFGKAVVPLTAHALIDGLYNFSNSTFSAQWPMGAYDSSFTAFGSNANNPTCSAYEMPGLSGTVKPGKRSSRKGGCLSTNTESCCFGATVFANEAVWTNSTLVGGGNKKTAVKINGNALYSDSTSSAPAAATVAGSIIVANSTQTVEIQDGAAWLSPAVNSNNSLLPAFASSYNSTTMMLNVIGSNSGVTLSSGTYYFKKLTVSSGALCIDLAAGTSVAIYLAGDLFVSPQGLFACGEAQPDGSKTGSCNGSANKTGYCACQRGGGGTRTNCLAPNIHIYGQGGKRINFSGYTDVANNDNYTYVDIYAPQDDVFINQRLLGRAIGKNVFISNPYGTGNINPIFFFDLSFGQVKSIGTSWVSGSWAR